MTAPAEAIRFTQATPETESRRTDDVLFNVRHLARNILSRELEIFLPEAEQDVFEQDITDIAESDVHELGPVVVQRYDARLGQYASLGSGTVDHARNGYEALDPGDERAGFELLFRQEDIVAEKTTLLPWVNEAMRGGAVKVRICPAPTPSEADPDVAVSLNYDGRTMFGLEWVSPDGQIKTMQTFSLFGVSAEAWAKFLNARYDTQIEPTSLDIRKFCNQVLLEHGSASEILETFVGAVAEFVDEDEKDNVLRQLDGFQNEQAELTRQATYYAHEKLAFEKEVALSLGGLARPKVAQAIHDVFHSLNPTKQRMLSERYRGNQLYVDDFVAALAVRIKTVTTDNRAGLATLNEHTVKRVASRIGLEATLEMAAREQVIQATPDGDGFMSRRNEQLIAESGGGCGGGCSVSEIDLFSQAAQTAREAGLPGKKLYSSSELDKNSKCSCVKKGKKAKVISDGKNVICVTCTDFEVNGKRGSLKANRANAKTTEV